MRLNIYIDTDIQNLKIHSLILLQRPKKTPKSTRLLTFSDN